VKFARETAPRKPLKPLLAIPRVELNPPFGGQPEPKLLIIGKLGPCFTFKYQHHEKKEMNLP
jgi:hypothetical protein